MLSEDGVNCKYNCGQDYKGKCVSCEKIAKEDVQETAYQVNNENVRNVSVLLVLPDGNQRLITFEVPIALDEYNILEAVKTQIDETKDCHLDMYTVIDENYDFDYIVESRTSNRNNESDTNIVINDKGLVNADSCTSVVSNHSNNSKTLSNVSDGLINSSPIAEHKFSVTKYSNEISSDASICGSELERIDIKINVGNGIKVQVGIESKEEKSIDMERTCVDEITMEETCSQEINVLVRTDTDGTETTTKTLTTESSDTSNSTLYVLMIIYRLCRPKFGNCILILL
ncbi:PREDICTED: uncharacterized protein LOC105365386 [Ceratosolen solmsi marchali]|uniref:Uncharacterized protein LOC105365386 n=1 Tax=Ceratosolen solmsi marchali TaxID=326594 RepID=A0AAJ6YPJ3_9HYME|nr:PREDICTED: uncharacterized protein LOC105365386 [Ceratosolen solmsi marchali]